MLLMERIKHLSRRSLIRLASFATALVITLAGFTIYGYIMAYRYRTQLEYTYSRALDELSNYLDNINFTLQKELYANTPVQIDELAASLWRDSGSAKNCLAQLPTNDSQIDNIYRFLSQVGDYSLSLSKKNALGGGISEEERNGLQSLSNYATNLSGKVSNMQAEINAGRMWIGEVRRAIESGQQPEQKGGFSSNLTKLNQAVTDYPTLVYDGPYSDHIMRQKPKLLENAKQVTREAARATAAAYMGIKKENLKDYGEENSVTPAYLFAQEGNTVAVTKAGGYVLYMQKSRNIDDEKLEYKEASAIAAKYLREIGLGTFDESYYVTSGGICIINYAFTQNGVICYSDLVKVGVALDTGEIMSLEARGYIMNHYERKSFAFKNTEQKARSVLSPLLEVKSINKALVMTDGLKEALCYEFVCKGKNNEDVLVYVNDATLQEEQIFILLITDGGVLTR